MAAIKLVNKNPLTNADVLITVSGVPGYWNKFSGVSKSVSRPTYSDGLNNRVRTAQSGSYSIEDVTISRAFDPQNADDAAALKWAEDNLQNGTDQDLVIRPVKRDGDNTFRGRRAWNVSGAKVKEVKVLESMDTGDGQTVVELSVILSVDEITFA